MRRFTPEEDQYLIDNYMAQSLNELGNALNRSFGSIAGRLNLLQLHVPDIIKKARMMEGLRRGWDKAEHTRYKKGHTPFNKGKKMPPEVYEKCSKTMFKKGQLPHNTKYDGATRITKDGYIEERVRPGCFKLKHRLVWEEHNGPVPKGCCIKFKDRNPLNVAIENLYLATRIENMIDNTIHRYTPEVKTTIRTLNKLHKTIRNYETDKH